VNRTWRRASLDHQPAVRTHAPPASCLNTPSWQPTQMTLSLVSTLPVRRTCDSSSETQATASWAARPVCPQPILADGGSSHGTGPGALVINTHRLNSISFDSRCNHCDNHKGGVVTVGAGVMMKDVYEQAWARNLDILGGECPVSTILLLKKRRKLTKPDCWYCGRLLWRWRSRSPLGILRCRF